MRIIEGDLFAARGKALGHGVNCRGAMGAGIAKEFSARYPAMFENYRRLCRGGLLRPGDFYPFYDRGEGRWIYNLASQDTWGGERPARLPWLATSLARAMDHCAQMGVGELHIPLIGAGLGGLEREEVLRCFSQVERNRVVLLAVHTPATAV